MTPRPKKPLIVGAFVSISEIQRKAVFIHERELDKHKYSERTLIKHRKGKVIEYG